MVCRSLGHHGLLPARLAEDVRECVCARVCLLLGEGRRGFLSYSSVAAVGGHAVNPPNPSGLTHKSIPLGNKGDYGRGGN